MITIPAVSIPHNPIVSNVERNEFGAYHNHNIEANRKKRRMMKTMRVHSIHDSIHRKFVRPHRFGRLFVSSFASTFIGRPPPVLGKRGEEKECSSLCRLIQT